MTMYLQNGKIISPLITGKLYDLTPIDEWSCQYVLYLIYIMQNNKSLHLFKNKSTILLHYILTDRSTPQEVKVALFLLQNNYSNYAKQLFLLRFYCQDYQTIHVFDLVCYSMKPLYILWFQLICGWVTIKANLTLDPYRSCRFAVVEM